MRWLNARTSLSPSIVNIWVQKNGSFSGKCCPGLTRDFITPCSWHWQQWHVWQWKPLNCLGHRRSIKAACFLEGFNSHSKKEVNIHLIWLLNLKNISCEIFFSKYCQMLPLQSNPSVFSLWINNLELICHCNSFTFIVPMCLSLHFNSLFWMHTLYFSSKCFPKNSL